MVLTPLAEDKQTSSCLPSYASMEMSIVGFPPSALCTIWVWYSLCVIEFLSFLLSFFSLRRLSPAILLVRGSKKSKSLLLQYPQFLWAGKPIIDLLWLLLKLSFPGVGKCWDGGVCLFGSGEALSRPLPHLGWRGKVEWKSSVGPVTHRLADIQGNAWLCPS